MTDWNFHNNEHNRYPPETLRELDAEFDAIDCAIEAKSFQVRRLTEVERRVRQLEQNTVTKAPLSKHTDGLCETIGGFVGKELDALERRITGTATVRDKGVWKSTEVYCAGETVTDHGSLWLCKASATMDRPGKSPDWRLAAKGGKGAERPAR
jgi:hypothetical protein